MTMVCPTTESTVLRLVIIKQGSNLIRVQMDEVLDNGTRLPLFSELRAFDKQAVNLIATAIHSLVLA